MSDFISADDVSGNREGKNQDFKAFKFLLTFAKPLKGNFIWAISLILVGAACLIGSARILGAIVDEITQNRDLASSLQLGGILIGLELTHIFLTWVGRGKLSQASTRYIFLLRQQLYRHINKLPVSYFDTQPEGRTITRMTHDVEGMEDFFSNSMGRLFTALVMFALAFIAMCMTYYKLAGIVFLAILPGVLFTIYSRKQVRFLNRENSRLNSACNAKLAEYLNGNRVIKVLGLETWSRKNYDQTVDRYLASCIANNQYFGWTRPFVDFLGSLPQVVLLAMGGWLFYQNQITVGVFVAFFGFLERLSAPLNQLTREMPLIQAAFTSSERVASFLQAENEAEVFGEDGKLLPERFRGEIVFDNITMGYSPENPVLKNVNFHIQPGEKIGLAGQTGSGKTTTVSLLSRLYPYQEGRIKIDGQEIQNYNRHHLRKSLGFISQNVVLFKGTLRENLVMGEKFSDEAFHRACTMTGLDSYWKSKTRDYDFKVLDNGANLSVGEKQLVALTRILLRGPSFLVMDEATANIDPELEKILHRAVEEVMEGKTTFMIAHRLDTLASCDRIFVFRDGEICEEGKIEELMQKKGYFYQLQMKNKAQELVQQSVEGTL